MKKVESGLNAVLERGKTRTHATFPQILFCLLSFILSKIFTIQWEYGGASAYHPTAESLFKRLSSTNLTLR
jgi:hypothetical protein